MRVFDSVQNAYINSLRKIVREGKLVRSVTDPSSIGSTFGRQRRDFTEILGYSFVLTNPRNRLVYSETRKLSFGFSIANFLWLLTGRRDVETISFYNKKGTMYSRDGVSYESAFGDRIFGRLQLWDSALRLLKSDESTRRALMPIFIPDDLKNLPNDTPCAASIQLMIRSNRLEFFLHMRSQSVAMIFPYDMFLFTMLHEYMSRALGILPGYFRYSCNSFHLYEEEVEVVEKILSEASPLPDQMDEMPVTNTDVLASLDGIDAEIRRATTIGERIQKSLFDYLPLYWKDLVQVLAFKASLDNGIKPDGYESKYLLDKNLFV